MQYMKLFIFLKCIVVAQIVSAEMNHPYPERPLTAEKIAQEVYFNLHGMHQKNAAIRKTGGEVALIINRLPGRGVNINTLEAFLKNDFDDGVTESKQLAIFKSGKMKGTGILMTNYIESDRYPSISIWLPSMRKVRRIVAPNQADKWMGTNMTYGDVYLRKPEHESHELLETTIFADCLDSIHLSEDEKTKRTKKLPQGSCAPKGKEVYRLKSTTKFKDWWYDYRLTDIDINTFSPYRSIYYKDDKSVKIIEADWKSLDKSDPRLTVPTYVYSKSIKNGQESMLIIPFSTIELNTDLPERFWSEKTLRKIKR